MTVGCAVHKTLSALHVGLENVVCAVIYGAGNIVCWVTGKYGLRVFESGVQRGVFGSKEVEVTGDRRKLIGRFLAFTPKPILLGWQNQELWNGQSMWHACGRCWTDTRSWYGNVSEKELMENLKICFLCKFSETLSLLTLPISALCYCTVFSVLLWMWQSVCSSYCRQLNAVSFSTALHAALYRSIYSLLTRSSLATLQGFLGAFAKFRIATISFAMSECRSVRPHGTTRLTLDGFSWNFLFCVFRKSFEWTQVSWKSDNNSGTACSRAYIYGYM
jgi:hypothetical protein